MMHSQPSIKMGRVFCEAGESAFFVMHALYQYYLPPRRMKQNFAPKLVSLLAATAILWSHLCQRPFCEAISARGHFVKPSLPEAILWSHLFQRPFCEAISARSHFVKPSLPEAILWSHLCQAILWSHLSQRPFCEAISARGHFAKPSLPEAILWSNLCLRLFCEAISARGHLTMFPSFPI